MYVSIMNVKRGKDPSSSTAQNQLPPFGVTLLVTVQVRALGYEAVGGARPISESANPEAGRRVW